MTQSNMTTIIYNGTQYTLTDNPQMDNFGTDGAVRFYGHAIDGDGLDYSVQYETLYDWDGVDQGDACDWDNPVEI